MSAIDDAIGRLPGGPLVCCVLRPGESRDVRLPKARVLSPREIEAFEHNGDGAFCRVSVWGSSTNDLWQVRRTIAEPCPARPITMDEEKTETRRRARLERETKDWASTSAVARRAPGAMAECHIPDAERLDRGENRQSYPAPDLPPPGWPDTGDAGVERMRRLYQSHATETPDKRFAGKRWSQHKTNAAEERSARRVLDWGSGGSARQFLPR